MEIIRNHLHVDPATFNEIVPVSADRLSLSKRRWRGVAVDNREFGFDLEKALSDGDVIFSIGGKGYVMSQTPEQVLEVELPADPIAAAKLAWQIGNLHFPVEVGTGYLRVADDIAVRQVLDREKVSCRLVEAVFHPLNAAAHGHHHHH